MTPERGRQAALPDDFLDWWFAPWSYLAPVTLPALSDAPLARRDAYRQWCATAGAAADLPRHFDAEWHIAAVRREPQLRDCARLFGGLFAARAHDVGTLHQLPRAEQAWCMSISLAQPLVACATDLPDAADAETRGLAELAWRLERHFPGMWSRLRLLIPGARAEAVGRALERGRADGGREPDAAIRRAQRCWRICRERAGLSGAT